MVRSHAAFSGLQFAGVYGQPADREQDEAGGRTREKRGLRRSHLLIITSGAGCAQNIDVFRSRMLFVGRQSAEARTMRASAPGGCGPRGSGNRKTRRRNALNCAPHRNNRQTKGRTAPRLRPARFRKPQNKTYKMSIARLGNCKTGRPATGKSHSAQRNNRQTKECKGNPPAARAVYRVGPLRDFFIGFAASVSAAFPAAFSAALRSAAYLRHHGAMPHASHFGARATQT